VRRLIVVLVLLLIGVQAQAGQNPDIRIYLDVDPPNDVHEVHPGATETFDVYVCLDCFGEGGGTRGVAFLLVRTFQGFKLSQTSLLGGLDFGDAEYDGWTIAAGADCVYPDDDGIVLVGVIQYLYLGAPGTLDLTPHPGTGRDVLDCNFESNYYCVAGNLGVSVPPNPGDPDCYCPEYWSTRVVCEPQGGDNPTHPPTYWYDVTNGMGEFPIYGFSVQVFDPDIDNYTNWVQPPYGWTHADSVVQIGDELWVTWCDPTGEWGLWGGPYRFGFDHPSVPAWGHWRIHGYSMCDPEASVRTTSHDFADRPDGYGYRVHVPVAVTPVEETSWGTIKALYR
jgi:hypothetical protein